MFKFIKIAVILFSSMHLLGQKEIASLPDELDEASALLSVDGLFISLNDSGNNPLLYVFDKKGVLVNKCKIKNAENIDWEALAYDGEDRIFIGDFGNNKNNRTDLGVYTVSKKEVLSKKQTTASHISFSYPDQKAFPPEDSLLYYDTEGFVFHSDSLFIFTKNRTSPFDGISKVYGLSLTDSVQLAVPYPPIFLKATTWLEDSVTDAYLSDELLFLLTYSKVYVFRYKNWTKIGLIEEITLDQITQKEGICYVNKTLYFVDEKSKFGKQKLYKLKYQND